MEEGGAVRAFSSLGHDLRLRLVRSLVRHGPDGASAGALAGEFGVPASSLSFHLGQLERAGVLRSWRVGRSIRYAADLATLRALLVFLLADCCGGHPEVCSDLVGMSDSLNDGTPMSDAVSDARPYNVLFLCTGNSARSILAETILNARGAGRFRGFSAGSQPKGQVHPQALQLLAALGHQTGGLRSKSWDEFASAGAPQMDFVFTVCDSAASEVCPVWPGQPMTAHWGIPDPAAVDGTPAEVAAAFAEAHRFLANRIDAFISLPIASLDRLSLKRRLQEIGGTVPA